MTTEKDQTPKPLPPSEWKAGDSVRYVGPSNQRRTAGSIYRLVRKGVANLSVWSSFTSDIPGSPGWLSDVEAERMFEWVERRSITYSVSEVLGDGWARLLASVCTQSPSQGEQIGGVDSFWFSTVDHAACGTAKLDPLPDGETQESPSMKLVDILAREMEFWPEMLGGKVGQCYDGKLHGFAGDGHPGCTTTQANYSKCDNWIGDVVTRAEWKAAVDALNAPMVAGGNERLNIRLGAMIDMGWLDPVYTLKIPAYDFGAFLLPRQLYSWESSPHLYPRSVAVKPVEPKAGLSISDQDLDRVTIDYLQKNGWTVPEKPGTTAEENKDFLEARVKLLEDELAERREETKHPINLLLSDADLLFLLRSESRVSAVNIPIGRSGSIIIRRADAGDSLKG